MSSSYQVILYQSPHCGHCRNFKGNGGWDRVQTMLSSYATFAESDVSQPGADRTYMDGNEGVPQIVLVIDDQVAKRRVGGVDNGDAAQSIIVDPFEEVILQHKRGRMMHQAQAYDDRYTAHLLHQCSMYLS
jgi:hypothetical protein